MLNKKLTICGLHLKITAKWDLEEDQFYERRTCLERKLKQVAAYAKSIDLDDPLVELEIYPY